MTPTPDAGIIAGYFSMLFGYVDWQPGQYVAIRPSREKGLPGEGGMGRLSWLEPAGGADVAAAVTAQAAGWARDGYAGYVVPGVLSSAHDARAESVALFTTIVVDIDSGDTDAALAWLVSRIGTPSLVVQSGGVTATGQLKRHVYWRLTEPTAETARVAALRSVLAAKCGGDQAFKRIPLPIRIPGTIHGKGGVQRLVTVESADAVEYDLEAIAERIEQAAPMLGVEPPQAAMPLMPMLMPGTPGGGPVDFGKAAGAAMPPPIDGVLTSDIAEGGTAEGNRWSAASGAFGHFIWCARAKLSGIFSIDQARERAYAWMQAHMRPPWPDERFAKEFDALVRVDVQRHGPIMPYVAPQGALLPSVPPTGDADTDRRGRGIQSAGDLRRWSVDQWTLAEPPARRFLVKGLVQCGLPHLLAAAGGAGKTFLCLDLALKIAAGDPTQTWLGQPVTPLARGQTVVMITAEDDMTELHIRLSDIDKAGLRRTAGERLIVLPLVNAGGAFPFVTRTPAGAVPSGAYTALLTALREIRPGLVIVDTLMSILHGEDSSSSVVQELYRELWPVCGDIGAALVATHHVRKAGDRPVRSPVEMLEAIRGSTGIIASNRAVIGIWHAHDYRARMKAMGERAEPGRLYRAAVVKANNPEMTSAVKSLLRDRDGMLQDVSDRDRGDARPPLEARLWLAAVVREAGLAKVPFTKTGSQGVFERRHELPPVLADMPKHRLHETVEVCLSEDRTIVRQSGRPHYLDVPGGAYTKEGAVGEPRSWTPDWDQYHYNPVTGRVHHMPMVVE